MMPLLGKDRVALPSLESKRLFQRLDDYGDAAVIAEKSFLLLQAALFPVEENTAALVR